MLKYFNNTSIALIPKKEERLLLNDYKPSSLCNIIYKVISKVIANRLKKTLGVIISLEQSGFSPNRSIYEGIILAHETIHSMKTAKLEKMTMKLDIRKAYDKMNGGFLLKVLQRFGFCSE